MMKKLLFFCCLLLLGITANATHNNTAEITYRWSANYTYEITVTTYTRASMKESDRPALNFHYGDGDTAAVNRVNGDGEYLGNDIKKNIYITSHAFPGPGTYIIYMEDYARIPEIDNIPNSVIRTMYVSALLTIPTTPGTGFSSVKFLTPPNFFVGTEKSYADTVKVSNPDANTSVSFELIACKGTKGIDLPGYVFPPGIAINATTGIITWTTPNAHGHYAVAVKVNKWQDSKLISYAVRDFIIDVDIKNGVRENNEEQITVKLGPNPFSDKATIYLNEDGFYTGMRLSVFDMTGKLVSVQDNLYGNKVDIFRNTLHPGVYLYRLAYSGKVIANGCIQIE